MALSASTQYANRYGLDIKIYALGESTTPLLTIDFANVSNIEVSGDRTWATGGQEHANKIGFNNPLQGTATISTQILTAEVLQLMSGGELSGFSGTEVVFKNDAMTTPKYYTIVAETVWQDASGTIYDETLTFHKASAQRAFNISYSGEGDPLSVDIVLDLLQDDTGKVITVSKTAHS